MLWLLFKLFLTNLRRIQFSISNKVKEDVKNVLIMYLFASTSRKKTLMASFRQGRSTTTSFTQRNVPLPVLPVRGQRIDRIAQF